MSPVQLFSTGTEYVGNSVTMTRGTTADITSVGVFHTVDAAAIPTVAQFTTVSLVKPGDPLAEGTLTDVLSLIGPKVGAQLALAAGTYQRWVKISTATEDIIRRPDTIVVT